LVILPLGEHPARLRDVQSLDQPARGPTVKVREHAAGEPSGEFRKDATRSAKGIVASGGGHATGTLTCSGTLASFLIARMVCGQQEHCAAPGGEGHLQQR
jgi:hypothetical protein